MQDYEWSLAIARQLSQLWNIHKLTAFENYFRDTYHESVREAPEFRCLYIVETLNGSRDSPLGGTGKFRWQVDDNGLVECAKVWYDCMTWSQFYATPLIVFWASRSEVAIYETLGHRLTCWKNGHIQVDGDNLKIVDLVVVPREWHIKSGSEVNEE